MTTAPNGPPGDVRSRPATDGVHPASIRRATGSRKADDGPGVVARRRMQRLAALESTDCLDYLDLPRRRRGARAAILIAD